MKFLCASLLAAILGTCLPSLSLSAGEPIPPAEVARLKALILPGPEEDKWSQIPWLTNLWEARQKAAAEGKPILLWEMDGHPLGCV